MTVESYSFFSEKKNDKKGGMLQYLSAFDPIECKYGTEDGNPLPPRLKAQAKAFEESQWFGSLSKQKYSYIAENLKLVYGDSELVERDILAYHVAEQTFIRGYLAIPQLEKMFDEDYFNFEWDMHVGQNFSEHRNDYYRDHFIHQIRNLYMMLVLLEKFHFYDACKDALRDKGASKISDYVDKKRRAFRENAGSPQMRLLQELHAGLNESDAGETSLPGVDSYPHYEDDYFFRYVTYSSVILSALFHDMGYPICHFLEVRHRVSDYDPTMYLFTRNAFESFDELFSKLSSSLLFTIVSAHEIKRSLGISKKGKYNHGAYSAIAFLLQFYNTGLIYSLSPEKQCAIELAAVAIYNHTAKYNIIDYDKENGYYAPPFRQNPISFLLRFCDDLQEWDRRYFEISEASDLMFCPKCNAPLLKSRVEEAPEDDSAESWYSCLCERSAAILRPDVFIKRKIFLVRVADRVTMSVDKNADALIAQINYDLYTLLMLSNINHTYAQHRLKELSGLKKLLSKQNYSLQSNKLLPFSRIQLDYFMSANPILIKLRILERYVRNFNFRTGKHWIQGSKRIALDDDGVMITTGKLLGAPSALVRNLLFPGRRDKPRLYRFLVDEGGLGFYVELLRCCLEPAGMGAKPYEKYIEEYRDTDPLYYNTIHVLSENCISYYRREREINDFWDAPASADARKEGRKAYYEDYVSKENMDNLYQHIAVYTDSENAFNRDLFKESAVVRGRGGFSGGKPYIGYFGDIRLFYEMHCHLKS